MPDQNVAELIEALGVQRPYDLDQTLRRLLTELLFTRENLRKLGVSTGKTEKYSHCLCDFCREEQR